MPELPEVETVRRGLQPALEGKVIAGIRLNRADLREPVTPGFAAAIEGGRVANILRRGKYLIVLMDGGAGFVLHLGMSGRVRIYGPQESYVFEKHDHAVFFTQDKHTIVFNDPRRFGMLYLTGRDSWQTEAPFSLMGPEPLGNEFSGHALHEKFSNRRVPVKNALLDQRVVAGVGNIYACEALYMSGLHPETPAADLSLGACETLAPAIRAVLERAIESGGSFLRDHRQTDGSLGYFQFHFSVYDREGQACPACTCNSSETGGIQRIVQAGRSTFYCDRKQPRQRKIK